MTVEVIRKAQLENKKIAIHDQFEDKRAIDNAFLAKEQKQNAIGLKALSFSLEAANEG